MISDTAQFAVRLASQYRGHHCTTVNQGQILHLVWIQAGLLNEYGVSRDSGVTGAAHDGFTLKILGFCHVRVRMAQIAPREGTDPGVDELDGTPLGDTDHGGLVADQGEVITLVDDRPDHVPGPVTFADIQDDAFVFEEALLPAIEDPGVDTAEEPVGAQSHVVRFYEHLLLHLNFLGNHHLLFNDHWLSTLGRRQ